MPLCDTDDISRLLHCSDTIVSINYWYLQTNDDELNIHHTSASWAKTKPNENEITQVSLWLNCIFCTAINSRLSSDFFHFVRWFEFIFFASLLEFIFGWRSVTLCGLNTLQCSNFSIHSLYGFLHISCHAANLVFMFVFFFF